MAKRVLILGGTGMLGHKLVHKLSGAFDTYATVRNSAGRLEEFADRNHVICGVSGEDFDSIVSAVNKARPDVIINCIGIVKQLAEAKDPVKSIVINSLLPHRISRLAQATGARFLHISTDCVFDGTRGNYRESDPQDAEDLYGRSKALGEVATDGALTIRTSIIGRQLVGSYGLVEWFLSQKGKVPGYTQAIFSGFPTVVLADIIKEVLLNHPKLNGLYHVSSEAISKFDLLQLIRDAYGLNVELVPDTSVICDRSLTSQRFKEATGIKNPSWADMICRMREDGAFYEQFKQGNLIQY